MLVSHETPRIGGYNKLFVRIQVHSERIEVDDSFPLAIGDRYVISSFLNEIQFGSLRSTLQGFLNFVSAMKSIALVDPESEGVPLERGQLQRV